MKYKTVKELLEKHHAGILNDKERELLFDILYSPENSGDLKQFIDESLIDPTLKELGDQETLELIYKQIQLKKETISERRSTIFVGKTKWIYVAVAASITILLGVALHFSHPPRAVIIPETAQHDIIPAGNKAVLRLADGKVITLNKAQNGKLAEQGNVSVINNNDLLEYNTSLPENTSASMAITYNTLSTPRGGKYQLILPDGTKAWLNAESSITFPIAFKGKERRVEIQGEIYFEVSKYIQKNSGHKLPFIVSVKNKTEIMVLGTHFNVNAYDDEATIKTTLLEGSVQVSSLINRNSMLIKPGQQASFNQQGKIIVKEADLEEATAWKEGLFKFESTRLEDVMRQIVRWYDVKVIYESHPDIRFTGIVSRNVNLSGIIQLLEANGAKVREKDNVVYIQ